MHPHILRRFASRLRSGRGVGGGAQPSLYGNEESRQSSRHSARASLSSATCWRLYRLKRMIENRYEGENVEAWIMPDIEAISYGRKVGYDLREADDIPPEVFAVSATGVRGGNRANVSQKVMEFMISEGIWDGE